MVQTETAHTTQISRMFLREKKAEPTPRKPRVRPPQASNEPVSGDGPQTSSASTYTPAPVRRSPLALSFARTLAQPVRASPRAGTMPTGIGTSTLEPPKLSKRARTMPAGLFSHTLVQPAPRRSPPLPAVVTPRSQYGSPRRAPAPNASSTNGSGNGNNSSNSSGSNTMPHPLPRCLSGTSFIPRHQILKTPPIDAMCSLSYSVTRTETLSSVESVDELVPQMSYLDLDEQQDDNDVTDRLSAASPTPSTSSASSEDANPSANSSAGANAPAPTSSTSIFNASNKTRPRPNNTSSLSRSRQKTSAAKSSRSNSHKNKTRQAHRALRFTNSDRNLKLAKLDKLKKLDLTFLPRGAGGSGGGHQQPDAASYPPQPFHAAYPPPILNPPDTPERRPFPRYPPEVVFTPRDTYCMWCQRHAPTRIEIESTSCCGLTGTVAVRYCNYCGSRV